MTKTLDLSADYVETPGSYNVVLDHVRYDHWKPSRKAPALERIIWDLVIEGGEHDGKRISHVTEIRSDVIVGLHRTLKAFGFSPPTLWEFEHDDADGRIIDPVLEGARARAWISITPRGFVRTRVGAAT